MEHIQDKSQLLNVSKITPVGEDDEEYSPSNKTRSAHHIMSVLKKVKDKVKKLKASITNFNKHDCDNQTQTEEAQYDHYSKAEDDCLDDKKVENTPNLPGKELPEKRPDQVLQPEIVWSSPGAFTRAKSFGSRSSFRIEVHRVRSHGETAKTASGEDDEQYIPSSKTRSARHNKSVLKKVKDKAKKLKASITNPNKHDHGNQTETEEAQYDHYSKAEDNCSKDKKAEITHDLPGKELPENKHDQVLQPEIDWSSPGAFTRAKGFGPRSAFRKEVHRIRSHEETAIRAAGEEPAAVAPLPPSVQAINTHDAFRKADQSLDAKPYKEKNVHFLDADTDSRIQKLSLGSDNTNQSVKVDEKEQDGTNDGQDKGITGKIFDTASTVKNVIFSKLGYESGQN